VAPPLPFPLLKFQLKIAFLGANDLSETGILEARLRPVEQLDNRPPWNVEGRKMQEKPSKIRDWVPIIGRVTH
jgi:hypothetical protein